MPKLPTYKLVNQPGHGWNLTQGTGKAGATGKVERHFGLRKDATKGGIQKFLGKSGGEVITEENGHFLGKHTYTKSEEPDPESEDNK